MRRRLSAMSKKKKSPRWNEESDMERRERLRRESLARKAAEDDRRAAERERVATLRRRWVEAEKEAVKAAQAGR